MSTSEVFKNYAPLETDIPEQAVYTQIRLLIFSAIFTKGNNFLDFLFAALSKKGSTLNPIALRMAKTLWSFGCSECSRVKKRFLLDEQVLYF